MGASASTTTLATANHLFVPFSPRAAFSLRLSFGKMHGREHLLSRCGEQEAIQGKRAALHLFFYFFPSLFPRLDFSLTSRPSSTSKPHPLATRSNQTHSSENLEENERIKAELNPTAIEEPKTPWHGAADSDDEEGGSAGGLGNGSNGTGGGGGPGRGISPLHEGAEGARRFEEALAAEASFFRNRSNSNGRASTASGEIGAATNHNNGNRSSGERGLSSSADADAESKRAAFEARRKAHYNMAEALRAARNESRGEPEDAGGSAGGGELEEQAVNGGVGAVRRRRQRRRVARGEDEEGGGEGEEEESSGESSGDGDAETDAAAAAAAESGENDTMEQSNGEMR